MKWGDRSMSGSPLGPQFGWRFPKCPPRGTAAPSHITLPPTALTSQRAKPVTTDQRGSEVHLGLNFDPSPIPTFTLQLIVAGEGTCAVVRTRFTSHFEGRRGWQVGPDSGCSHHDDRFHLQGVPRPIRVRERQDRPTDPAHSGQPVSLPRYGDLLCDPALGRPVGTGGQQGIYLMRWDVARQRRVDAGRPPNR